MAKRGRKRKGRFSKKSFGSIGWKIAGALATPVSFLDQVTKGDRGAYSGLDLLSKLKTLSNNITGRIGNFNIFGDVTSFEQSINPSGIFENNQWTKVGALAILYSIGGNMINQSKALPKGIKVPSTGRIGSIGKKTLLGGLIGGLFSNAGVGTTSSISTTSTIQIKESLESGI